MNHVLEHKHVIIRAEVEKPPMDTFKMTKWFEKLIHSMEMEILMGPFVVYHPDIGNRGMTGICAIKTSSITLHCWDECKPSIIQLDVYSCKDFRLSTIWRALEEFEFSKVEYKFLDRENGLKEITSGTI